MSAAPANNDAIVTKQDANNYCRILTVLGMEEEGDPVAEVARLLAADRAQRVDPPPSQSTDAGDVSIGGDGIEVAARWVEARRDDYVNEHGHSDPDTGAIEFPGNGDEYVGELEEIIEGIRSLAAPVGGEGAGRYYIGGPYHDGTYSVCETETARVLRKFRGEADLLLAASTQAVRMGMETVYTTGIGGEGADAAAPAAAPVAWRYQDARGHFRYCGYKPGFDSEYAILKPVPLYAAAPPAPAAQPAEQVRDALEVARDWIGSAPHGDNCFLHDDGGEYDSCFCGKDSVAAHIDSVLAAPAAQPVEPTDEFLDLMAKARSLVREIDAAGTHSFVGLRNSFWSSASALRSLVEGDAPAAQPSCNCQVGTCQNNVPRNQCRHVQEIREGGHQ